MFVLKTLMICQFILQTTSRYIARLKVKFTTEASIVIHRGQRSRLPPKTVIITRVCNLRLDIVLIYQFLQFEFLIGFLCFSSVQESNTSRIVQFLEQLLIHPFDSRRRQCKQKVRDRNPCRQTPGSNCLCSCIMAEVVHVSRVRFHS